MIAVLMLVLMSFTIRETGGSHDNEDIDSCSTYNMLLKLGKLEEKAAAQEKQIEILSQKLKGAEDTIANLNKTLINKIRSSRGTSYIRWGRTECPGDAELVYEGYAAGSSHTYSGSGANTLCLPRDPNYDEYLDGYQSSGRIFGAEYETNTYSSWKYLNDNDVPCAVCRIPRTGVLMVPGKNVCHENYKLEYKGYLMSEYHGHHASEFLCVDEKPEAIERTFQNFNGRLFYFVEGECGSLACPPYKPGWELTCAVCSYSPKGNASNP